MVRQSSLALGLLLLLSGVSWSSATNYTVGDAAGWTTGVDYAAWASGKTFLVGDFLIFNYASDDTLDEVSLSGYSSCRPAESDGLISYSGGNTITVAIRAAGTSYYFISGTPSRCSAGMKLAVTTTPSGTGTENSGTVSIGPVHGLALIGLAALYFGLVLGSLDISV